MKKVIVMLAMLLIAAFVFSQDLAKFKLYKPEEKAEQEIGKAVKEANKDYKHVLIQIGGGLRVSGVCALAHLVRKIP